MKLLALLTALLAGLVPIAARAGEPGGAPPAAVGIRFTFSGQFSDTVVALTANGVVNDNGDLHLALAITQPESHMLDEIISGGVLYLSIDGQPYQSIDLQQAIAGGPSGATSGCENPSMVAPGSGLGDLERMFGPGGNIPSGPLLQPVGTQVIDGVETQHLSGQIDLAQAAPVLSQIIGDIGAACGLPVSMSDLQALPTELMGATLNIDAYLEQPGGFPRQINVALSAPAANIQFMLQANLTPEDTATPILPPQ